MQDVFNRCAAEFINTLVVIADNHYVPATARKQKRKLKLGMVCVLKFVDQNIIKLALIFFAHLTVVLQKEYRLHDYVVKVHGVRLFETVLIICIYR